MGIFGSKPNTDSQGNLSSTPVGERAPEGTEPSFQVQYTDKNGRPASETAYSMIDADTKARAASDSGGTTIRINPFKRGR